jgi:hypothetical protein
VQSNQFVLNIRACAHFLGASHKGAHLADFGEKSFFFA